MLAVRQPQQRRAEQRPGGEIERPAGDLRPRAARISVSRPTRQRRRGRPAAAPAGASVADHLHRPPVVDGEGGAQRLVAARRPRAATAREGADVERAVQAHGDGDVVGRGARLELVEEPEPLLGEGERQIARPRGPRTSGGAHRASAERGRLDPRAPARRPSAPRRAPAAAARPRAPRAAARSPASPGASGRRGRRSRRRAPTRSTPQHLAPRSPPAAPRPASRGAP